MRRICCSPFCDALQPGPPSVAKTDSMGNFGSSNDTNARSNVSAMTLRFAGKDTRVNPRKKVRPSESAPGWRRAALAHRVWSENWILQRTNTRCDFCSTSYCLGNIVNWQCTGWILNPTSLRVCSVFNRMGFSDHTGFSYTTALSMSRISLRGAGLLIFNLQFVHHLLHVWN
jgi:hypothetical protein